MGKRKHKHSRSDEELLSKIRRLERRVKRRRKNSYSSDSDPAITDHSNETELENKETLPFEPEVLYSSDADEVSVRSMVSRPDQTSYPDNQRCDVPPVIQSDETLPAKDDAVPSTSADPPALSAAILDILGDSKEKDEPLGPKIREEISKRWGKIIMEGLNKDQKLKVMEGVLIPENFQLLKAPKLSPEIAAVLNESSKNRDKRLEKAQNHLGVGIASITNLMSTLIDTEISKDDIIKKLSETGQILMDLHNRDTFARRQLITFSLDKKFHSMIKDVKRDSYLFGENLGEKIKASKTAEKSGLQIKRKFEPRPSTSYRPNRPYNSRQGNATKGPPRQYAHRGRPGGPRTQLLSAQTARRLPAVADRYNSATNASKSTNHKNP